MKQNGIDDLIYQKLQQTLVSQYPNNLQVQLSLTNVVKFLFNATELFLNGLSTNPQMLNMNSSLEVLQALANQFNILLSQAKQSELLNITETVSLALETFIQSFQYWNNLSGFNLPYNESDNVLKELQSLINVSLAINSEISPLIDTTTVIQILSAFNQSVFDPVKQTFLGLMNSEPSVANITSAFTEYLTIINQALQLAYVSDSSLLANFYLKQISNLISSNNLQSNIWELHFLFHYSNLSFVPSDNNQKVVLEMLSFITSSNLQQMSANPVDAASTLFNIFSKLIPIESNFTFNKLENSTINLLKSIVICQNSQYNCTKSIFMFQQVLAQSIHDLQKGLRNVSLIQFNTFSSAEIDVINKLYVTILCAQESANSFWNISKDVCNETGNLVNGIISYLFNNTLVEEVKKNLTGIQQVLTYRDMSKLVLQLEKVINESSCFANREPKPLDCTMKLFSSLVDLLLVFPLPQQMNETIHLTSTIVEFWLRDLNSTLDFVRAYNLTMLTFQSNSSTHDIGTVISFVARTVEEAGIKLNAQGTSEILGVLLEMMKFSNINISLTNPALFNLNEQNIKTQLQMTLWYILYLKNVTESIQTGDLYQLVTAVHLILNNIIPTIKQNPSLTSFASEINNIVYWLENSNLIMLTQNIANAVLQGNTTEDQTFNQIMSIVQIILQDSYLWNSVYNETSQKDVMFVLSLLQELSQQKLTNLKSILIQVENILITLESILNDSSLKIAFNDGLGEKIFKLSIGLISIISTTEQGDYINKEIFSNIYHLLLQDWDTSSLPIIHSLESTFLDLLELDIQCLSKNITAKINPNCSVTDIMYRMQNLLSNSSCQVSLALPGINNDITLTSVLETILNSTLKINKTECAIEGVNLADTLGCFAEIFRFSTEFLSKMNDAFGFNITWVAQFKGQISLVLDKFLENNITCPMDMQAANITQQAFESQLVLLRKIYYLIGNYSNFSGHNQPLLTEQWIWVGDIVTFYISESHSNLSNSMFNTINKTMFQIVKLTENLRNTTNMSLVTETWKMLYNLSNEIVLGEQMGNFSQLLSNVSKVIALVFRAVKLDGILSSTYGNFSGQSINVINILISELNVTSVESCKSSMESIFSHQQTMGKIINSQLISNMSSWTCKMIFGNDSMINWMEKLKNMIDLSKNITTLKTDQIIISLIQELIQSATTEKYIAFIKSLTADFKDQNALICWDVYKPVRIFVDSILSLLQEALSKETVDNFRADEKITSNAFEVLDIFLNSLNITGYEDILSITNNTLQLYFKLISLPLENITKMTWTQFLTYLKQSGFENLLIQIINSPNTENPETVKILQTVLNTMFNSLDGPFSEIILEAPYLNSSILANMIRFIVGKLNDTILLRNSTQDTETIIKLTAAQSFLSNLINKYNITMRSEIIQFYDSLIYNLSQTHFTGYTSYAQTLSTALNLLSKMNCQNVFDVITYLYSIIQKEFPSNVWPSNSVISNTTKEICELIHWNTSQNNLPTILRVFRTFIAASEPFTDGNTRKYMNTAENIVAVAEELMSGTTPSYYTIVTIMKMIPNITDLFNSTAATKGWVENTAFHNLLYLLLDLAWSSSSPEEVLFAKVKNVTLEAIQSVQDILKGQNESSYTAMFSLSLDGVKLLLKGSSNTSNDSSIIL
ncbi:hypothetical protein GDO86_017014 [Hymenochirus boettgeri]|uniref:Uncharacterized protein n=1 Tax=Hymenochirus boettgeri TaxID=247094 RepID=A0A8T2INI5_9PIPI|nr:hypothetical protein GDO86_017014 [Hymenochirus boettgeri]